MLDKWYLDTLKEARRESRMKWRRQRSKEEKEGGKTCGKKEEDGKETEREEGEQTPLTVSHLQGLFLVYFLGLLLAGVSFMLEILHFQTHTRASSLPPPSLPTLYPFPSVYGPPF